MDETRQSNRAVGGGTATQDESTTVRAGGKKRSASGLTRAEAERLLREHGYNELAEEKKSVLLKFLSYFWGPIPWMIEIAAILSAVVQHWPDFGIILALLVANVVVGFWEEYQAGNAIAALKKKLALHARVKRDGVWATIPAREVVPGDVIRLRIGDIIPADAQLLEGDPIELDQSALTGESLPVHAKPVKSPSRDPSFARVKPMRWSLPLVRRPTSARPHNWSRKPTRRVTSSERS